jgi:regulator of sigma E protease
LAGPAANLLLALLAFAAAYKFAAPDLDKVLVSQVVAASPAASAGMLPGDLIVKVNDTPIVGYPSLQTIIAAQLGKPVLVTLQRQGQTLTVQLTPRASPPEGQGPMGVVTGNPTKLTTVPESLGYGLESLASTFYEILHLPAQLLLKQIPPDQARLSGLKGMYDMMVWAGEVDRSAQRPFVTLNLIGVFGAGLALANLLPIPALDGGRLMFVLIEAVIGRRISPRYEGVAHAIGFALLLALMVYVNFQDFLNPIPLPH